MYIECEVLFMDVYLFNDNMRVNFNFSPSNELYLKLNDYYKGSYGCESFYTKKLTINEVNELKKLAKPQDKKLIEALNLLESNQTCIIDCIIHRGFILKGE